MSIEKMSLIHVMGNLSCLDTALLRCCDSEIFHPEIAANSSGGNKGFETINEENPFSTPLQKCIELASNLSIPLHYHEYADLKMDQESIFDYIRDTDGAVAELNQKIMDLKEKTIMHEQAVFQLQHVSGLDVNFEDIFSCKYANVRFGRLPFDSFVKLDYFANQTFFFVPFDHDADYYWGVYFVPKSQTTVVDSIFDSLYFERIRIPEYAHGTPEKAIATIARTLKEENRQKTYLEQQLLETGEGETEKIQMIFSLLKNHNDTFDMRKYVVTAHQQFYLVGFVPKAEAQAFIQLFTDCDGVVCEEQPADADKRLTPPVKLKNNWFVRPFEMFVSMYGLPSYGEINPTPLVAITYTLLFGIMFGDVGQGLLLSLIGMLMWKLKKMELGAILARVGISSACFGVVYGSVFGFEHLLDPLFHLVGLKGKPIEVFESNTTNKLLIAAVGIGVIIIIISIILNIVLGLKKKDFQRAFFSNNGVAGLILYGGAILAAVLMLMFNINILSPLFIILVIVVPLLLMFLREPLGKLVKKRKDIKPKDGIGGFIVENFFELFEFLLSYVTNTMSFLRVGGFILSHAGMMAVVMTLMEMVGSTAGPFVLVIGNLFVMALEGLLVGIQVLRLEFYEIFSRFYDGDGKPYDPAKISYDIDK